MFVSYTDNLNCSPLISHFFTFFFLHEGKDLQDLSLSECQGLSLSTTDFFSQTLIYTEMEDFFKVLWLLGYTKSRDLCS